jgi:hypothetical protein
MTEVDAGVAEPTQGTAAHYLYFLDWAEKKGELPASTVQNWRVAAIKVLEIEDDWRDVNVVDFDLEAQLSRFEILKRAAYTTGSMGAYKSRTKTGIESYRAWLSGASDWKPKNVGQTRAGKNNIPKKTGSSAPATVQPMVPKGEIGGYVPHHSTLIEYPFPLRPGVRALIALPEDLTEKEAKRVAKFIESLAIADENQVTAPQPPLAITTGPASDEAAG